MKAIAALLTLLVSALAATPSDPGAAAVHFLEKVRANNLNLEPGGDTALSPHTSGPKRQAIARRLERLARDLGNEPLEVGAVKLDDELAAVLVRKTGGFDPGRLQVFPVALVKRDERWAAAPVPASFENAGVGYAAILRQRLAILEDWMRREQVLDLDKLRDQAVAQMARQSAASLPPATLRSFTAKQAAARFLTACERRNLPEIFGLLGGLSATLPNDWELRLKAVDAAIAAAAEVKYPWRQLISPAVLRIPVAQEEDGDSARVTIACLDPAGSLPRALLPRVELVHLELSKTPDGFWRIDPPEVFLQGDGDPAAATDEPLDAELLNAFPAKFAELHPPSPQPTAGQSREALISTLQDGSLVSLLRFIRLDGEPKIAREGCAKAAQLWWTMQEPLAITRILPLGFQEHGNQAAGTFQFFSARNPDLLNLRILYFNKSAAGWYWVPQPKPATEASFSQWAELQGKRWRNQWQDVMLAHCTELEQIPAAGAPADEEARQLIEAWFQASRAGDVMAALRLTARLKTPGSNVTLLRNLGHEMTGAHRTRQSPAITGIYHGDICTAVGAIINPHDQPTFPLYPVVATPAGPRILLEIDLLAAANRSRDFLNKTAFERLRQASAPATEELQRLFSKHQSQVVKATPPKTPS